MQDSYDNPYDNQSYGRPDHDPYQLHRDESGYGGQGDYQAPYWHHQDDEPGVRSGSHSYWQQNDDDETRPEAHAYRLHSSEDQPNLYPYSYDEEEEEVLEKERLEALRFKQAEFTQPDWSPDAWRYGAQQGFGHRPVPTAAPPLAARKRVPRWVLLAACLGLVIGLSATGIGIWVFAIRSTPVKTLDEFCGALQKEDYTQAYTKFTRKMQANLPEAEFAGLLSQDKVITCTHGGAGDDGAQIMTTLVLVHSSQKVNNDVVTLAKDEDGVWKIVDVRQMTPI